VSFLLLITAESLPKRIRVQCSIGEGLPERFSGRALAAIWISQNNQKGIAKARNFLAEIMRILIS
jgi:hypothetical protein